MFLPPWFMAAVWPNLCPNSNKVLLFHQAICHIVCPYFFYIFENMRIWVHIFNIFHILKKQIWDIFLFERGGIWHREVYVHNQYWSLMISDHHYFCTIMTLRKHIVLLPHSMYSTWCTQMIIWYQPNDIYHHCWVANLSLNFSFRARAFYWHWLHVCHSVPCAVALYKH